MTNYNYNQFAKGLMAMHLFRLITVPLFVVLLLFPSGISAFSAVLIFCLTIILNIADKPKEFPIRNIMFIKVTKVLSSNPLIISCALIMLTSMERVDAWIVCLIILCEISTSYFGYEIHKKAKARFETKRINSIYTLKTIFQGAAVFMLLIQGFFLNVHFLITGKILLMFSLPISFWEVARYFLKLKALLDYEKATAEE